MFQSTYVYGYNWLPGELGKLPYYWPGQNPALGNVIWQWGVSGELLYLPQSSLFYSPFNIYPPPINPWGPGQLDDYSLQGIYAARTYQLFPALYKSGTSTMISPYVGTGNWDAFHGLGDRYTYMQFNEWGPVVAFYNSTGSNYGEDFATELGAYYGGLGYDFQFQLDQIQQRTDWILDRTVNPNGSSTSAVGKLLESEDDTRLMIDPRTGNTTLVGDGFANGAAGGGALAGGASGDGTNDRTDYYLRNSLASTVGSAHLEMTANTTGNRHQYATDPLLDTIPFFMRQQLREQRISKEIERQQLEQRNRVDPNAVEALVRDKMAVYVRRLSTRPVNVPDYPVGMTTIDQPIVDPEGYVVVTDAVGDRIVTAIFEKQEATDGTTYYSLIWKSDGWPLQPGTTAEDVAAILKDRRTSAWADRYIETFVTEKQKARALNDLANDLETTQQFLLHLIPGASAAQAAYNQEWGEFAFSLAGDAALLLGGPLKALANSRGLLKSAEVAHLSAVAIEGTIGGVRLGQSAYEFYNGDNTKAAGHLGEAFLRLYGVKLIAGNRGVWGMRDGLRRGEILEARLGKNTPTQFPRIDRWEPESGLAISIKTTDLKGRTLKAVETDLRKWAREIANFPLRVEKAGSIIRQGLEVELSDITSRGLRVGIEPGVATSAHQALFNRIREYATNDLGLDFIEFVEVK
jgi:hypothetical protein